MKKNNDVEMTVTQNKYTSNLKDISLEIINKSDSSITFDFPYQLETYVNGSWYKIPFKNNKGWIMIGIVLKPNESYTQNISVKQLDFELSPGEYRIVKSFSEELIVSAEFLVE
ncbi:hypothetical protein MUN88_02300 [Gracilibacillus caseinilyticus]|uniref:Bacterial Ig-like domain-containing protein n=1 Tax=Gracilibacillus caseinilyticus TaxID=2932256 RepID=A0ABY4EXI2_9BACI|nr:immunoglobulin-like domain-containing protein [Gracilibacillus caseinilyticus]UOQ48990.1 hypothetical protein MUN88_02300 [Gracilibacillus caseinilyticus]